jgi:hypothetical protein
MEELGIAIADSSDYPAAAFGFGRIGARPLGSKPMLLFDRPTLDSRSR